MSAYRGLSNKVVQSTFNREAIEQFKEYLNGMGNTKNIELFDPAVNSLRANLLGVDAKIPFDDETLAKINDTLLGTNGSGYFAKDIVSLRAFKLAYSDNKGVREIDEDSRKFVEDISKEINVVFGSQDGLGLGLPESMESMLMYPEESIATDQLTAEKDSGNTDSEGVIQTKKGYQVAELQVANRSVYDVKTSISTQDTPDAVNNPSLAAFELPSGRFSLPNRNGDAITVFFNAIPTLEMSKCVPYLNIITVTGKRDNIKIEKFLSLDIQETSNTSVGQAVESQLSSNFFVEDPLEKFSLSTMDTFLTPQTLTSPNNKDSMTEVLEPLAPFLSVKNFSVSITGLGVGLYSSKKATLKLTLHDRSKMNLISPLISVKEFGKTRFIIDYGWASHSAEAGNGGMYSDNVIARFLNSLRDGGVFNLISSSLQILESSVDITLELAMSGEQDSFNTLVSCGYLVQSNVFRPQIEEIISEEIEVTKEIAKSLYYSMPDVKTTVSQMNSQMSRADQTMTWDKFQDILQSSGSERIVKIGNELNVSEALMEVLTDFNTPEAYSEENKEQFSIDNSKQTLLQHMSLKLFGLREGNDPFLNSMQNIHSSFNVAASSYTNIEELQDSLKFTNKFVEVNDTFAGTSLGAYTNVLDALTENEFAGTGLREYASLGRVLSLFVGYPLSTLGRYDEVQLFFYPLNDYAAGAHIYTTASFPINISKLIEAVNGEIFTNPNLTITRFFSMIEKNFTGNPLYEAFLLGDELKNLKLASGASVDGLANQFKKSQDKEVSEEDRNKLSEDFSAVLTLLGMEDQNTELIKKIKKGTDLTTEEVNNFKEKKAEAIKSLREDKKDILNKIYTGSPKFAGSNNLVDPKFVKPNISMHFESLQGNMPNPDNPDDENSFINDPTKRILRVHIYDEESSPNIAEITMIDLITQGKLTPGKDLVKVDNVETGKNGRVTGGDVSMGGITTETVKSLIKSRIPNITYGSQFSPIENFSISSNTNGGVNQALLLTSLINNKSPQTGQSASDPFGEVKLVPTTANMKCLGCPILERGGQFFVDLKTNTTADNVYAIQSVSHNITPGNFSTDVNMTYVGQSSAQSLTRKIENVLRDYAEDIKTGPDSNTNVFNSMSTVRGLPF